MVVTCMSSPWLFVGVHFVQPTRRFQQLARPRAVRRSYKPIALHEVDQVRRTAVADAQAPLEQGSGSLAEFKDEAYGIVEHGIVVVLVAAAAFNRGTLVLG